MFFLRHRPSAQRFIAVRVGLFFFAAGLWLAGVRVGDSRVTAAAIGVAAVAILLGLVTRRLESRDDEKGVDSEGDR